MSGKMSGKMQAIESGKDAVLRMGTLPCSLGYVLVACSEAGLVSVAIGADPAALRADFRTRFPDAEIIPLDDSGRTSAGLVAGKIDRPETDIAIPLDMRGTPFQRRVWQALRAIPPGETRTYADIAAAIGAPQSVRAVAGACARNRLAVVIPCHRVIRKNGSLGGYRWGLNIKRELLRKEKQNPD